VLGAGLISGMCGTRSDTANWARLSKCPQARGWLVQGAPVQGELAHLQEVWIPRG
jgi:hypothetical protein